MLMFPRFLGTKTFRSAHEYVAYLAKKSGASMTSGTFSETASKFKSATSFGITGIIAGGVGM